MTDDEHDEHHGIGMDLLSTVEQQDAGPSRDAPFHFQGKTKSLIIYFYH